MRREHGEAERGGGGGVQGARSPAQQRRARARARRRRRRHGAVRDHLPHIRTCTCNVELVETNLLVYNNTVDTLRVS